MSAKGKTRWYPRHINPVRLGEYECVAQISRSVPSMLWRLEWDGVGFLCPVPLMIHRWRGRTKAAATTPKATP